MNWGYFKTKVFKRDMAITVFLIVLLIVINQ